MNNVATYYRMLPNRARELTQNDAHLLKAGPSKKKQTEVLR
ncbi:MAG: hypothetical protein STSR0009_31590 [Methanoregula sp.]